MKVIGITILSITILMTYLITLNAQNTYNKCSVYDPVDKSNQEKKANHKKKWAIIALAKPRSPRTDDRNREIIKKIKPYSHLHDITILFFSELTFPSESLKNWEKDFKGIAKVRIINTSKHGFDSVERFGYKYMCKFFSLDVYQYLKNEYDYYIRCDTDCYYQELSYDIFQWAEDNNVGYGFALRKLEAHQPTKKTLPQWTAEYIKECSLEPSAPMDEPLSVCFNFYNNFHIGRVDFFLRPDVQHFLKAVNTSGHIQSHRWGDSTIQAYAVRLFMNPKEIIQLPNFSYIHGSHGDKLVSTFGDGHLSNVPQRLPNWKYTVATN